jgi:hypothetical protein
MSRNSEGKDSGRLIRTILAQSWCADLRANWLAFHEKIDRLVLISGHDAVDTIWRHYYKGTTKATATAFWNLYPPAINPENVVSFPIAEKTSEFAASH